MSKEYTLDDMVQCELKFRKIIDDLERKLDIKTKRIEVLNESLLKERYLTANLKEMLFIPKFSKQGLSS